MSLNSHAALQREHHLPEHVRLNKESIPREIDLLWDALLNIPVGVLALDAELYILKSNTVANSLIGLRDGLHCYNGYLRASSAHHTHILMTTVKRMGQNVNAGNHLPATLIKIPRNSSDRDLEIALKPAPRVETNGDRHVTAIGFICDPTRNTSRANKLLESLYRLTPAEAQLAAFLMQGKSLHDAADILSVKKDTVRKHLQAVFAKTRTSRQGELVRLLMGGVASLEL